MMYFTAIVTPDDHSFVVTFPAAPGCVTQVEPGEEILTKATDALSGWIEVSLDAGDVVAAQRGRVRAPRGSRSLQVPVLPEATALRVALRAARAESGLSQAALAQRLGVSPSAVKRLDRGVAVPTVAVMDRISSALERTAIAASVRDDTTSAPTGSAADGGANRARGGRSGGRRPARRHMH